MAKPRDDKFWPTIKMAWICRDARDVRVKSKINILALVSDAIGSSVKNFFELGYFNKS